MDFATCPWHQRVFRSVDYQYRYGSRRCPYPGHVYRYIAGNGCNGSHLLRQFGAQPVRHHGSVRYAGYINHFGIDVELLRKFVYESRYEADVIDVLILGTVYLHTSAVVPVVFKTVWIDDDKV